MRLRAYLSALMIAATPALALDIEEIGQLDATFNGKTIAQPTVLVRNDGEEQGTAFMMTPGGGFTFLALSGFSPDNSRLDIEIEFHMTTPGSQAAPSAATITYAPAGTAERWTSDGAPTPPSVTITTLETGDDEGRAAGSFAALLCYSEDYEDEGDPDNCHPIEGSFDTRFFNE